MHSAAATISGNPELGNTIDVNGVATNYHDMGSGSAMLLLHGSGPGVTAWANWRLTLPELSSAMRVVAPDLVGFGYTQRPEGFIYNMDSWVDHLVGFMDVLNIQKASITGNSFGGALALALAIRHPHRVDKLVLMGSAGVPFKLTEALDKVWGYTPSIDNMKQLLEVFVFNQQLITDELAELRYRASVRPGFQESFSSLFPAPRQSSVDALCSAADDIRNISHPTLIVHGRDDEVIPLQNAYDLLSLIDQAELHVFGRCGHWTQIERADAFNRLLINFCTTGD